MSDAILSEFTVIKANDQTKIGMSNTRQESNRQSLKEAHNREP